LHRDAGLLSSVAALLENGVGTVSKKLEQQTEQDSTPREAEERFAQLERELRAYKEHWQAIVANPFMGITVLDKNQYFVGANSTYQEMVGYTEDELRKLTPLDITPAVDREINRTLFKELQQGVRQHYELTKRLQRKDGELIWIQLYVFGIPDRGSVGMSVDITEKMRAEQALQAAQEELARSAHVSRMGAMTASIAHEINQPLAAIVANGSAGLRWLARTPPDLGEVQKSFEETVREGQRAADVVRSVRSMFKSEEELVRVSIDLNRVICEVLVLVQGTLQRQDIIVRTELDEMLSPVTGSPIQLQQVLFNLVSNAIEAMESAAERVILIKTKLGENREIHVAVEDSGTGIDQKNMDRIFNSFFTTKMNGMGMGLSICRSIIESHGGRLWATPGHPRGAIFRFTLPAE
jgi:PAS domain S-box-containing protein